MVQLPEGGRKYLDKLVASLEKKSDSLNELLLLNGMAAYNRMGYDMKEYFEKYRKISELRSQ
jgi:hypothetical protein